MQYAICDVIGTGTTDDPYRAIVSSYNCDYVAIYPDDHRCAFVKFRNGDIAGAQNDPGVFDINLSLSTVLTNNQANAANTRLSRWNIQTTITAGMTVRQALVAVINELDVTAEFQALRMQGVA